MTFLVLVAANLNGSSVGALDETASSGEALLAGTPRTLRGDEYIISTPLAVSAARQGFPRQPYVGLTPTLQEAVPQGAPTRDWVEIFKPQDWGYLALGAHRGLAVHWWFPYVVSLIGVFLLLRTLALGARLSGALAVVASLTPYTAWWSSPAPGLVLGYGALTGAALVTALRTTRPGGALGWGAIAGAAGTAMFLTLYPPWLISVGLVIVAVVAGYALDVRSGWARLGLAVAGLMAVSAPALAGWYLGNQAGIESTKETFYPGNRVSAPGEATLAWLLDAPLNPLLAGPAGGTLSAAVSGNPYTNLSEVSASWLPLPILAAAAIVAAVRWPRKAKAGVSSARDFAAGRWTVTGLAAVLCLLLAWGALPLPQWVGTLLLERVKGTRLPLSLGLAAVLLIAVMGSARRGRRIPVWEHVLWSGAVAATVGLTLWSAAHMPWNQDLVSTPSVVLLGLVVALGFGLVASGQLLRTAATLLAVYAAWSWALVNPLYHGLGPLDHDPVVRAMRHVAQADPGVRVAVFGDARLVSLVRASGVQSLSGVTLYPNEQLMRRLVPSQRDLWNNYAIYQWVPDPGARPARIRQVKGTSMELHIPPCAPEVLKLGAEWAVSDKPLDARCLQPVDVIRARSRTTYLYRINGYSPDPPQASANSPARSRNLAGTTANRPG
jgi:hypothetical protein